MVSTGLTVQKPKLQLLNINYEPFPSKSVVNYHFQKTRPVKKSLPEY
jgi:hypothetical protein